MQTPWGPSQTVKQIAPGITDISTAGHGGYKLSEERMKEFRAIFPDFKTFAGGPWFEEDQDVSAVIVAFSDHFSEEATYYAVESVKASATPWERMPDVHLRWVPILNWLNEEGNKVAAIAARFAIERADFWQTGGLSSSGQGWRVQLRRLRDGAEKIVTFANYPGQGFYNDADLSVLAIG